MERRHPLGHENPHSDRSLLVYPTVQYCSSRWSGRVPRSVVSMVARDMALPNATSSHGLRVWVVCNLPSVATRTTSTSQMCCYVRYVLGCSGRCKSG